MQPLVVRVGLDVIQQSPCPPFPRGRWGLLMNQASVDCEYRYACDVLTARFPGCLAAIFSPQHGLWGEEQANMRETPHGVHPRLGIPVYSLYSETRRPTAEMLGSLDGLIVDLQDVGTRVYTFAWTLSYCLEACAAAGLPAIVLDRPNPLGGEIVEGPLLGPDFASFVGRASIPMRHGLTIGELARLLNEELAIGAALQVVPLAGWRRSMLFPETGLPWVLPSPNMPRFETALLYPGQVLLEGTNLSEGRGTTTPFETVGAPFVEPDRLLEALDRGSLPGLRPRAVRFRPTFDKWQGAVCGGLSLQITAPRQVRSFQATVAVLTAVRALYPAEFAWLPPPYEYEARRMPIDILYGGEDLRRSLDAGCLAVEDIERLAHVDATAWQRRVAKYLLYE